MAWGPGTARKTLKMITQPRGMLRQPSPLVLDPNVATLADNVKFGEAIVKRRPGCVQLTSVSPSALGAVTFDANTANYISVPYNAAYNLGIKWAVVVHVSVPSTPGGTQYIYSRDVTPTTSGKFSFWLRINSSGQLAASTYVNGTEYALSPAAATALANGTKYAVLLVRDGTSFAMYFNGSPTAVASRNDLPIRAVTQPGTSEGIYLGQSYNGSSASGAFAGTIGYFGIFRDFDSLQTILRYTTTTQWPNPADPRCLLHAPFGYWQEQSGSVVYDWSSVGNNGSISGSLVRAAPITEFVPLKGQSAFVMDDITGLPINVAVIGGVLYVQNVVDGL